MPAHATRRAAAIVLLVLVLAGIAGPAGAVVGPNGYPGLSPVGSSYQLFYGVLVNGDDDLAASLIAEDAVVHSDRGSFLGPEGVLAYLDALRWSDPDADVELVDISVDGAAVTIRWELHLETATHYGRTLATLEDGTFTEVWMLNESDLATAEGGSATVESAVVGQTVVNSDVCPPICTF